MVKGVWVGSSVARALLWAGSRLMRGLKPRLFLGLGLGLGPILFLEVRVSVKVSVIFRVRVKVRVSALVCGL